MKNFFYIIIILLLFISVEAIYPQYKLISAFSNLPDFQRPVEIVHADDGTNRLFVAQQKGYIYVFDNNENVSTRKIFLDLSGKVSQLGSDLGLLGLAFHPNFENNRKFYVYYTFDSTGNSSGRWCRLAGFKADSLNNDTTLLSTMDIMLTVSKPYSEHNGGKTAFGSDGYLYFTIGDGGNTGDPQNNAQNRTNFLGKISRINVDSAAPGKRYSIPPGNPYVGHPTYKQEIFCYGLRNVWKFCFDPPTNRIWAADVGQFAYEEINIIQNGKNYGWNKMEGFHCYPANSCDTTGRGYTRPVIEFPRDVAVSIIGGYVYRGTEIPEISGKYIFGDWYFGKVWALNYDGVNPVTYDLLVDTNFYLSSFGVDQHNELYAIHHSESTGKIYKLVNESRVTVNLKVILEGHYNFPVNILNKRDTVKAYLYSSATNELTDSAEAIIDSLTFNGLFTFQNAPSGRYFITVKHKNGLETWSKSGGEILSRGTVVDYDFTLDPAQALGNNLKLVGTKYCVISGDCNQDGIINAIDRATVVIQSGLTGSYLGDLDGNGIVDDNDKTMVISNLGKFKMTP